MSFYELASERYSVRKFKDTPVPDEIVKKILKVGRLAPTACNKQPQQIIVLKSPEGLALLRKCTECHYNAPLAFIVCYDKDKAWKREYDGKCSGDVDASIVSTHMMFEAWENGIGSTWVMYFIPEAVKTEFGLPDNIVPVSVLVMGYPDAEPSPRHFQRDDPDESVIYK